MSIRAAFLEVNHVQRQVFLITVIFGDFCLQVSLSLKMLLRPKPQNCTYAISHRVFSDNSCIKISGRRLLFFFQEMIEILPLLVSEKLCTAYFSVRDSSGKVVNFFFVMQQVGCWFASYRPR